MTKNSLVEAFHVHPIQNNIENTPDYDIFPDKELLEELRKKIIAKMIDQEMDGTKSTPEYINNEIDDTIEGYDLSNSERSHLYHLIDNEMNGYGPITELLNDNNITEIMINSPDEIYTETNGILSKDDNVSFINNEHIKRCVNRLIGPMGRTVNASNPIVDCRLKDGSRMNVVLPPLSMNGPVVTIRKFNHDVISMDDLIRLGSLTPYMADFLAAAVKGKCNIIVSGGSGAGKTTLLNILSSDISSNERIITIEDVHELHLESEHVISLETTEENYQEGHAITIQDLVINALRMRPDRIIVGEVRGREAFDMLQAMNTGHEGSLTTLHANSPKDALNRLETMVLMNGMDIPIPAVREYIASAIDVIVHIERLSDGKRKITSISEISGIQNNELQLNEIFAFHQKGLTKNNEVDGEYILYQEKKSKVLEKLKREGIHDIDFMFESIPKVKLK